MDFDDEFDELSMIAYQTAFQILGSRSEAEEIAQETLIKASLRWREVRSHARPWVGRVAANHSIDVLRKRRRRDGAELRAVQRQSPDRVDDRLDLQRALLELPRRQRDVLVLRFLVDLTETEVADALGISIGSVKTHAHRALEARRSRYGVLPRQRPIVQKEYPGV